MIEISPFCSIQHRKDQNKFSMKIEEEKEKNTKYDCNFESFMLFITLFLSLSLVFLHRTINFKEHTYYYWILYTNHMDTLHLYAHAFVHRTQRAHRLVKWMIYVLACSHSWKYKKKMEFISCDLIDLLQKSQWVEY